MTPVVPKTRTKPRTKDALVKFRVTPEQMARYIEAAEMASRRDPELSGLSAWCRRVLNAAADVELGPTHPKKG